RRPEPGAMLASPTRRDSQKLSKKQQEASSTPVNNPGTVLGVRGTNLTLDENGRSPLDDGVRGEELWVISKQKAQEPHAQPDDNAPGAGALMAKLPGKTEQVAVPLKHTDVKAWIAGYIATVNVQQQYHNPYNEKIEAVYVFPLPQNAAVNEFVMTIGERRIRGIIRER